MGKKNHSNISKPALFIHFLVYYHKGDKEITTNYLTEFHFSSNNNKNINHKTTPQMKIITRGSLYSSKSTLM